ncbi:hypothetical protein WMF38_57070 [Sorangium sp. So ce118]
MTASLFASPVAMPDLSTPCAWAGVGSRDSPADVLALMTRIARRMAELGHALRSGAAPGADTAFEAGHREVCGVERLEIYLPWRGFEGRVDGVMLDHPSLRAEAIAARLHPGWTRLTRGARLLHSRNAHQVLGCELDDPVRFVLCWTTDGATTTRETSAKTGGTGQAIRIATAAEVPTWNLQREDHRRAWERWLDATPTAG